ncbi:efflux transporter outer membrane subunit [Urechidicola sp. KH5]
MKNLVYTFIICALVACNLAKPYSRPKIATPTTFENYMEVDSTVTNLNWWELFNDEKLIQLIDSALVSNRNMQVVINGIQQAQVAMEIANADRIPAINYGLVGTSPYNSRTDNFNNSVTPALTASYTVDLWGRIKNLNEVALQNYLATKYAQRALQINLVSVVAQTYIQLRDIDNRLIISEKTADNFKSNLAVMQARSNAGFISDVDLAQSKIQVSEALTAVEVFKRVRKQTEHALGVLVGNPELQVARGLGLYDQLKVEDLEIGVPSSLLNRRPDLLIAEQNLHAQTLQIGITEALKYPSLTLNASIGAELINPSLWFADLGGQLLGPLFNANKINNAVTIEELKTESLLLEYENTFIQAVYEVKDAIIALETYKQEFTLREEQRELATTAADLSWVRYDGGMTSYLEVLNLQSSQFNAELKASEAYMQKLVTLIQLYEALGGGWNVNDVLPEDETTDSE